jgi:hypothetical protein
VKHPERGAYDHDQLADLESRPGGQPARPARSVSTITATTPITLVSQQ